MVYLPEGKMKSREGKIVDADDLITAMIALAETEIRRRDPEIGLSGEEVKSRAEKIGVGAIKFYLLRVRPTLSINFDPAESISLTDLPAPIANMLTPGSAVFWKKQKTGKERFKTRIFHCSATPKKYSCSKN